jgi:hypothetical protein
MLPREEKYIYDWETKRSKGKWSYLLLTALIWGSIFPAVIRAFKLAFNGELSFGSLFRSVFNIAFFPVWIEFVGGFFLFALLMWHLAKRKYQELKRRQAAQRELHFQN